MRFAGFCIENTGKRARRVKKRKQLYIEMNSKSKQNERGK